jgi:hypothetical protein
VFRTAPTLSPLSARPSWWINCFSPFSLANFDSRSHSVHNTQHTLNTPHYTQHISQHNKHTSTKHTNTNTQHTNTQTHTTFMPRSKVGAGCKCQQSGGASSSEMLDTRHIEVLSERQHYTARSLLPGLPSTVLPLAQQLTVDLAAADNVSNILRGSCATRTSRHRDSSRRR